MNAPMLLGNGKVPSSKNFRRKQGLVFGAITLTWTFSGLLSMGPFPIIDRLTELTVPAPARPQGQAGGRGGRGAGRAPNLAAALRGRGSEGLAPFRDKDARAAIASVPGFEVKELEYTSFAGEPVYLATNGRGETHIIPVRGTPKEAFDTEEIMRVVREAAGKDLAQLRVMDEYDAYFVGGTAITGGRGTQSGLYRVTYTGNEPTAPVELKHSDGAESRAVRSARDGAAIPVRSRPRRQGVERWSRLRGRSNVSTGADVYGRRQEAGRRVRVRVLRPERRRPGACGSMHR